MEDKMEYRRKCQVCGKIYCYTDKEVSSSKMNKIGAALTGIAMLSGGSRTVFDDILLTQRGDSFSNGIRDFKKCPSCGSMSTIEFNGGKEPVIQTSTPQPEVIVAPAAPHIEINTNASPEALVKRAMLFMEDGDWDTAKAYCNAALDADPENAVAYIALLMVEQRTFPVEKLAESIAPFDDNVNYKRALRYASPEFAEEIKNINQAIIDRIALAGKEKSYNAALHEMKYARKEAEYLRVAEKFRSIIPFQDAELLAEQCIEKASEKKAEAQAKLEADYQSAISDAKSASDKTAYWAAINALKALGGYKDSKEQIAVCQEAIDRIEAEMRQEEARRLEAEKKAATARAKKQKKLAIVAVLLVLLAGAGYWAYQYVVIPNQNYNAAVALMEAGKYAEAYTVFVQLKGYKDVDNLLATNENLKAVAVAVAAAEARKAAFKTAGSYVTFGTYEQDNNKANGQEAIEWQVLEVQGNKALLISRYGLDAKPYNTEFVDMTWEECSLRSWLNKDFLNAAFSAEDQKAILTTDVDNSVSQGYSKWSTNGGSNTQDKVFLLSYAEANKYFGVQHYSVSGAENNTRSRTSPTAYAEAQGAYTSDSNKTAEGAAAGWWLRSPGSRQDYAACVRSDGSLRSCTVSSSSGCVRPAFWINLESDIF